MIAGIFIGYARYVQSEESPLSQAGERGVRSNLWLLVREAGSLRGKLTNDWDGHFDILLLIYIIWE